MAITEQTKNNEPARVDEYLCGDCKETFVMRSVDEPTYCPNCGTELDLET